MKNEAAMYTPKLMIAVIVMTLCHSGPLGARPSGPEHNSPAVAPRITAPPIDRPDVSLTAKKSQKAAFLWALGGWFVPVTVGGALIGVAARAKVDGAFMPLMISGGILMGGGAIVGPSAGHFYAGDWKKGLLFSGLRLGLGGLAAGFITWGVFWMFADSDDDPNYEERQGQGRIILAIGSVAAAAAVMLQIWEVAVTPRSVYRINRRKREQRKFSVLPTPFLARDPSTGKSYVGLGAAGTF
jgi:hypothetical protein